MCAPTTPGKLRSAWPVEVSCALLPAQEFPPFIWQFGVLRSSVGIHVPRPAVCPSAQIWNSWAGLWGALWEVTNPPPKTWSGSKETPLLILLLLTAKEHLAGYINLQDLSYFNRIEKDWCFGVVLCYIKIHISNNKCFPFIQASLFSTEPNFQAVS